ncbi:MFS transporter [Gordonia sp. HY002]|uniref:MFS transporter n=1 Tax=Gordonia zhenghanii TaxID=2911516 RepID=UPI001EF08933|nr:MFS transporter [Gordonia zhenghanii]MCF8571781.1 MFS transporter [Gordonia zhenghanii]MCF8604793.1 MFS transporter [Gordonia zhenghanii]
MSSDDTAEKSPTPPLPGSSPGSARTGSPIVTVIVLCLGGLIASLMQTLIVPIQPQLPELLGTSVSNASWVITATLLGGAVAMPVAGRLGDMFGKRRILLYSAVILAIGSLIPALTSSLIPVVAGRALQGLAMGFIPVGISLMREVTPPKMTAFAISAMSATLGVGGAIGMPLSAFIAETYDWHMLFWVSVVLALVVVALVFFAVPRIHDAVGGRFDFVGAIGLAIGLSSALVAVTKGNDWGWTSGTTLGFLLGGFALLIVWGFFELRTTSPLVDLRTSARPSVLLTNVAAVAVGFGMMAQAVVIPMMMELPEEAGGMGQTILQAGLWMAPGGLMMLVFAPVSGYLMNTIGAKFTLAIGAAVLGLGYLCGFFLMDAPWQLALASLIASAGVGIGYAAMPTLIMGSVPITEAGAAVGLNGLMRSVGTTTSSAIMAVIMTSATVSHAGIEFPSHSAFETCFLVGAIAAFVGVAITLVIPSVKKRAAAEIVTDAPTQATMR